MEFFSHFFVVVQVQLSVFLPPLPPPQPFPLPTLFPTPPWFCPCVLYTCSWRLFPLFPPLTFGILIMMCLGVDLFGSNLFGTFCVSWTCMFISFTKLGEFSFIIFSNKFSISCSSSSPSGTSTIWMLAHLEMSQGLLKFSLFFWILVSSFCSGRMSISSLCSRSMIWISASFPSLLVSCGFLFP